MQVEIAFIGELQKLARFFHNDNQYDPVAFISTTWSGKVTVRKIHYDDWLDPLKVKLPLPNQPGLLVLSLFTMIVNANGVRCRLHAATAVVDVHNIHTDGYSTTPVANYRAGSSGLFRLSIKEIEVPKGYVTPAPYKQTSVTTIARQIQKNLSMFNNMKPADKFLLKCHVPIYRLANQILPGDAYFSTHNTVELSTQWFELMGTQIATRHDTNTNAWAAIIEKQLTKFSDEKDTEVTQEFHEAVGMALEIATAAVQSYEYVADFFVNTHGVKEMYESFDNYFRKRCGDCEDSAVAIKEILYNMEMLSSPNHKPYVPQGSFLYWLGKLAELYVPCCVLGMVGHVSFTTVKTQARQAHMYVKWIPRQEFYARLPDRFKSPTTHKPWESSLLTWVGEGTSAVAPFPKIAWILSQEQNKDSVVFENRMAEDASTPIGNMAHVYNQRRAAQRNTFYNLDIHAFTHKLSDLRGRESPVVFSFVDKNNTNKWGIDFEQQLRGDYKLKPHALHTKAKLNEFDNYVKISPVVKITAGGMHLKTEERVRAMERLGSVLAKQPNKNRTLQHGPVYTEYIVRGWNKMSTSDFTLLYEWLNQNFTYYENFEEGWDTFSESRRFRVFKPNRHETL